MHVVIYLLGVVLVYVLVFGYIINSVTKTILPAEVIDDPVVEPVFVCYKQNRNHKFIGSHPVTRYLIRVANECELLSGSSVLIVPSD